LDSNHTEMLLMGDGRALYIKKNNGWENAQVEPMGQPQVPPAAGGAESIQSGAEAAETSMTFCGPARLAFRNIPDNDLPPGTEELGTTSGATMWVGGGSLKKNKNSV